MNKPKKKALIEVPGTEDADLSEEDITSAEELASDLDTTVTPVADEEEAEVVVDDPASDDTVDDSSEDDTDVTAMSADEFALATVAKSIKDNGLWLNKDEQIPVFDGATEDSESEAPHSHLTICQKTADGNIVGRTYATIGDVAEHNHVIHASDKEGVTTRDADSGENHTHAISLVELVTEIDDEALDLLITGLEAAITDEESKRLTTEQREALKTKEFCGPNRSFPVTDAEHVKCARQLVAKYKGDAATKERICRSIERKANKLGVDRQADSPVEPTVPVVDEDGQAQATHRDEVLEEAILDLATEKAKTKSLESSLTEKSQEINALEDDLAREKAARSKALANTLTMFRMILVKPDCAGIDNEKSFKEKVESFAGRTPESLWDAVSDLLPEVDLVIRNLQKSNTRVLPSSDSKEPLKHVESTGSKGTRVPSRGQAKGADQLAEDLDS